MSRIRDNSDLRLERRLIQGYYKKEGLGRLRTTDLERILSKIIQLECKKHDGLENTQRPEWWPAEVIFFNTLELIKQQSHSTSVSWRSILKNVVGTCLVFTRKTPLYYESCSNLAKEKMHLNMSPKTRNNKRLRPRNQGDTTYSELEQSIISNSKKRRLMESAPLANIVNMNDNFKEKIQKNEMFPVLLLKDILKPAPIKAIGKAEFMSSLKLLPSDSDRASSNFLGDDIETKKYDCGIPFSSDIGRILMKRDRYVLSKEFYLRKIEKLDYYLSDKNISVPKCFGTYDVTYNKKDDCNHLYKFPKRQFRQGRNYLEYLRKGLCRPFKVRLVRAEIKSYQLKKLELCRNLSVVIERISDK